MARYVFIKSDERVPHTVFNIKVYVDLLQSDTHAGTPDVRKHNKLDVRRCLVVVEFVLASSVGDETNVESTCQVCIVPAEQEGTASPTYHPRRLTSGSCFSGRRPCRK